MKSILSIAILVALTATAVSARSPRIPSYAQDLAPPHSAGSVGPAIPAWALESEFQDSGTIFDGQRNSGTLSRSLPRAGRSPRAWSLRRYSPKGRSSFSLNGNLRVETSVADAAPPPPVREVGIMKRDFSGYKKKSTGWLNKSAGLAGGLLGLLVYLVNPIIGIAMVLGSFGIGVAD